MKTMTKTVTYVVIGIVVFALGIIWSVLQYQTAAFASAPSGLPSTVASSTQEDVIQTAARSIAATSTNCASRIITTGSSAIMLTFGDYANQSPSGTFGHWQGASTTVAYDGGIYGCGLIKAINSNGTASIITVTETR